MEAASELLEQEPRFWLARRLALVGTELARAQCGTIRVKLLKIGARVRVTVRRIWVSMSESYPYRDLLLEAWARLHAT